MRWLPRNAGTIDLLQGKYTLILLLSVGMIEWILLVFPLWVFWIGVHILIDNFRGASGPAAASPKE